MSPGTPSVVLFIPTILFALLILGKTHATQDLPNTTTLSRSNLSFQSECGQDPGIVDPSVKFMFIFMHYVTPVLFALFFLVGTIGNMLVILVILANPQMRNTTNILIFSLAIADLTILIVCIPSAAVVYITGRWPMGDIMCRLYWYTAPVSIYCSVYTLLLMSLDRFLAVVYPIECINWRKPEHYIKCVIAVWAVVMLANLSLLIKSGLVTGPANGNDGSCLTEYCTYSWLVTKLDSTEFVVDNVKNARIYFALFFLFGYFFPFIIISSLYMTVVFRLRCRKFAKMKQSAESLKSKKRVTKLVVAVVSIFGISMLPLHIVFLYQYFAEDTDSVLFRMIQIFSTCLAYGNSCVNPILYAFISVNFRQAFFDLFRCRRPREVIANTCVPLGNETVHETLRNRLSPRNPGEPNSALLIDRVKTVDQYTDKCAENILQPERTIT